jgi:hypothetical protein
MLNLFKKKDINLEAIDSFREEEDNLITFNQLKAIPLNKTIDIIESLKGAIECTRISSVSDSLMFTVTMKAGQLWQNHHHDCVEKILVYQGKLIDLITNNSASKMMTMTFKPYKKHYVLAEEDSTFYVEFENPKK